MNPATFLLIIQGLQAALAAEPQIERLVIQIKTFLSGLFYSGLITAEQQNAVMAHVDEVLAAAIAGTPPPAWTVEPDPIS